MGKHTIFNLYASGMPQSLLVFALFRTPVCHDISFEAPIFNCKIRKVTGKLKK